MCRNQKGLPPVGAGGAPENFIEQRRDQLWEEKDHDGGLRAEIRKSRCKRKGAPRAQPLGMV